MSEALKEARKITHVEARTAWIQIHDALYCGGQRPLLSIPRRETDVDMVLDAYFEQQEKLEAASSRPAPAPEGGDERAKELAYLLCRVHANLDKNDHLEPFDNCIACIRVERDELNQLIQRISTDIAQTIIEDPIKSAEGWVMMSQPILKDIQAVCEGLHKIALAKLPAPEGTGRDE